MKRLVMYFFILLCAIWVGLKIQADAGYVLIAYRDFGIETTLWFALLIVFICFLLFYFLIRFLHNTKILPRRLQFWWHGFRERLSIKRTDLGLIKLAEGDFSYAEKKLLKAARFSPNPFLNYIEAAYAAEKQSAYKRRDNYLAKASLAHGKSDLAVGIIKAKMQIKNSEFNEAALTLDKLRSLKPKNKLVLKLLHDLYKSLSDWEKLQAILPLLHSCRVFTSEDFYALEKNVYLESLKLKVMNDNSASIQTFWLKMPRHLRCDLDLTSCYVGYLIANKMDADAEGVIRGAMKKSWQPQLLEFYSAIKTEKPLRHLAYAKRWLYLHSDNASLWLCLGVLCKNQELWGKAREYLEKSLKINPTKEAYFALGDILATQGEIQAAMECYRKMYLVA